MTRRLALLIALSVLYVTLGAAGAIQKPPAFRTDVDVVVGSNPVEGRPCALFSELLDARPASVDAAS